MQYKSQSIELKSDNKILEYTVDTNFPDYNQLNAMKDLIQRDTQFNDYLSQINDKFKNQYTTKDSWEESNFELLTFINLDNQEIKDIIKQFENYIQNFSKSNQNQDNFTKTNFLVEKKLNTNKQEYFYISLLTIEELDLFYLFNQQVMPAFIYFNKNQCHAFICFYFKKQDQEEIGRSNQFLEAIGKICEHYLNQMIKEILQSLEKVDQNNNIIKQNESKFRKKLLQNFIYKGMGEMFKVQIMQISKYINFFANVENSQIFSNLENREIFSNLNEKYKKYQQLILPQIENKNDLLNQYDKMTINPSILYPPALILEDIKDIIDKKNQSPYKSEQAIDVGYYNVINPTIETILENIQNYNAFEQKQKNTQKDNAQEQQKQQFFFFFSNQQESIQKDNALEQQKQQFNDSIIKKLQDYFSNYSQQEIIKRTQDTSDFVNYNNNQQQQQEKRININYQDIIKITSLTAYSTYYNQNSNNQDQKEGFTKQKEEKQNEKQKENQEEIQIKGNKTYLNLFYIISQLIFPSKALNFNIAYGQFCINRLKGKQRKDQKIIEYMETYVQQFSIVQQIKQIKGIQPSQLEFQIQKQQKELDIMLKVTNKNNNNKQENKQFNSESKTHNIQQDTTNNTYEISNLFDLALKKKLKKVQYKIQKLDININSLNSLLEQLFNDKQYDENQQMNQEKTDIQQIQKKINNYQNFITNYMLKLDQKIVKSEDKIMKNTIQKNKFQQIYEYIDKNINIYQEVVQLKTIQQQIQDLEYNKQNPQYQQQKIQKKNDEKNCNDKIQKELELLKKLKEELQKVTQLDEKQKEKKAKLKKEEQYLLTQIQIKENQRKDKLKADIHMYNQFQDGYLHQIQDLLTEFDIYFQQLKQYPMKNKLLLIQKLLKICVDLQFKYQLYDIALKKIECLSKYMDDQIEFNDFYNKYDNKDKDFSQDLLEFLIYKAYILNQYGVMQFMERNLDQAELQYRSCIITFIYIYNHSQLEKTFKNYLDLSLINKFLNKKSVDILQYLKEEDVEHIDNIVFLECLQNFAKLKIIQYTLQEKNKQVENEKSVIGAWKNFQKEYQKKIFLMGQLVIKIAFKIGQKFYGNHPLHSETLLILGNSYYYQNKYLQAYECYKKALKIKQLNRCSPSRIANLENHLGDTLRCLKHFDKAMEFFQKSYSRLRVVYGMSHPNTMDPLANIGNAYIELHQFKPAELILFYAFDLKAKCYGRLHYQVGIILNSLGVVYYYLNMPQKILKVYADSLNSIQQGYGEKHVFVSVILNNIGVSYFELYEFQSSKLFLRDAIKFLLQNSIESTKDESLCTSSNNLVNDCQIESILDEISQISSEMSQSSSPITLPNITKILNNLGLLYMCEIAFYIKNQKSTYDVEIIKKNVEQFKQSKIQYKLLFQSFDLSVELKSKDYTFSFIEIDKVSIANTKFNQSVAYFKLKQLNNAEKQSNYNLKKFEDEYRVNDDNKQKGDLYFYTQIIEALKRIFRETLSNVNFKNYFQQYYLIYDQIKTKFPEEIKKNKEIIEYLRSNPNLIKYSLILDQQATSVQEYIKEKKINSDYDQFIQKENNKQQKNQQKNQSPYAIKPLIFNILTYNNRQPIVQLIIDQKKKLEKELSSFINEQKANKKSDHIRKDTFNQLVNQLIIKNQIGYGQQQIQSEKENNDLSKFINKDNDSKYNNISFNSFDLSKEKWLDNLFKSSLRTYKEEIIPFKKIQNPNQPFGPNDATDEQFWFQFYLKQIIDFIEREEKHQKINQFYRVVPNDFNFNEANNCNEKSDAFYLKIVKKIGSGGGNAQIYMAESFNPKTKQVERVALKLFNSQNFNYKALQELLNEITNMQQFNHENIIKQKGIALKEGGYYGIVMELLYWNLNQIMKAQYTSKELTRKEKLFLMLKIAKGIQSMHCEGSRIHRDLKPSNIFVDKSLQQVKIGDLATISHSLYDFANIYITHIRTCTPKYAGPEFIQSFYVGKNQKPYKETFANDIWCFGVMLNEMFDFTELIDDRIPWIKYLGNDKQIDAIHNLIKDYRAHENQKYKDMVDFEEQEFKNITKNDYKIFSVYENYQPWIQQYQQQPQLQKVYGSDYEGSNSDSIGIPNQQQTNQENNSKNQHKLQTYDKYHPEKFTKFDKENEKYQEVMNPLGIEKLKFFEKEKYSLCFACQMEPEDYPIRTLVNDCLRMEQINRIEINEVVSRLEDFQADVCKAENEFLGNIAKYQLNINGIEIFNKKILDKQKFFVDQLTPKIQTIFEKYYPGSSSFENWVKCAKKLFNIERFQIQYLPKLIELIANEDKLKHAIDKMKLQFEQ